MATVRLTIGDVGARGNVDNVMVYLGDRVASETITSGATSVAGTLVAGDKSEIAQIYSDGDVWVMSGAAPVATASNGLFCPSGAVCNIAVQSGHKVAVIDA